MRRRSRCDYLACPRPGRATRLCSVSTRRRARHSHTLLNTVNDSKAESRLRVTPELAALTQHPERAEQALVLAIAQARCGQDTQALTTLLQALDWGIDRLEFTQRLIDNALPSIGRATALAISDNCLQACPQRQAPQTTRHRRTSDALQIIRRSLAVPASTGKKPAGADVIMCLQTSDKKGLRDCQPTTELAGSQISAQAQSQSRREHLRQAEIRSTEASSLPLFYAQLEHNGKSQPTPFYVFNHDGFQDQQAEGIAFRLPSAKHAYLITNPSGGFDEAPNTAPFSLVPNHIYRLRAQIACDQNQAPVLWVFDYSRSGQVYKHSSRSHDGAAEAVFRTSADHHRAAFAIRIAGEGRLHPEQTLFWLSSGAVAEQRYLDSRLEQTEAVLKKEQARQQKHTLAQLEDFVRLQTYMGPDIILPAMHGWPISPDFALLLIKQITSQLYQAVIEFGSGVSTLIIARALQRTATKHKRAPTAFLSLEHLEHYHAETQEHLAVAGLQDRVDLVCAPLVPYQAANGQKYPYYDLQPHLRALNRQIRGSSKVLAVIDGPPCSTRTEARYPALPVLLDHFPHIRQFDLLMDDYIRDDERAIVQQWEELAQDRGLDCKRTEYLNFEKRACLLAVERSSA